MITYLKWILIVVLGAGAVLKLIYPESITNIILFFGVLNETIAYTLVYFMFIVEIVCCVLLMLKIQEKKVAGVILGICFFYFVIGVVGYWGNLEEFCGEFSQFSFGRFDLSMMLRNLTLFVLSIIVYYHIAKKVKTTKVASI